MKSVVVAQKRNRMLFAAVSVKSYAFAAMIAKS
jgi:hypothetical protein